MKMDEQIHQARGSRDGEEDHLEVIRTAYKPDWLNVEKVDNRVQSLMLNHQEDGDVIN